MNLLRSKSLAEVVDRACPQNNSWEPEDRWMALKDFYLEFYLAPKASRAAMLEDEPRLSGDEKFDAWLGAAAEYLSQYTDKPPPAWSDEPCRFLHRAWFASNLEKMKPWMVSVTPVPFRRRMIFTDAEPLFRPAKLYMDK